MEYKAQRKMWFHHYTLLQLSPPLPSTSNAVAASAPISEEESALLADKRCVQQEMDDLERLLAAKRQQHKLVEKWKAAQTKQEEEMKVRARTLAEAVMAEVRQAAKHANKCAKDVARKVTEELQRLQSLAKGKQRLVSIGFLPVVMVLKFSTGQRHTSESEGHASDGEGFAGGCEEWWVEAEDE